jgi:hypothetical protein
MRFDLDSYSSSLAIARTKDEYANAVVKVLGESAIDIPFAAFYFNTVESTWFSFFGSRHSNIPGYLGTSSNVNKKAQTPPARLPMLGMPPNLRVSAKLAGSAGIPPGQGDMPEKAEFMLDPITLQVIPDPSQRRPFSFRSSSDDFASSSGDTPSVSSEASTVMALPHPQESILPTLWPFYDVFSQTTTFHVDNIPFAVANGLERRGWGDIPREAVVIPIAAEGDGTSCTLT